MELEVGYKLIKLADSFFVLAAAAVVEVEAVLLTLEALGSGLFCTFEVFDVVEPV